MACIHCINFKTIAFLIAFYIIFLNLYAEPDGDLNGNNDYYIAEEINYDLDKNNYFISIKKNFKNNRYIAVQKLLEDFKAKYPDTQEKEYYFYSGIVNEFKGDKINAIKDYQKAIEICPEYSQARNYLAGLYLDIGKNSESEGQFLKAVKANPYNPFINYNIGDMYFRINKLNIARKYLEKACKYKANYGKAYNKLGIINYNMKEYSKALENFNKAIEFNCASYETHFYLGLLYNKSGQVDLAISNLNKAFDMNKDLTICLVELGKIHQTYKEYSKAIDYYQRAESMDFDNVQIRLAIAECYYDMKRYDDAIDVIEGLEKLNPDNEGLLKHLSEVKENKFSKD